jgi:hypothetical protein
VRDAAETTSQLTLKWLEDKLNNEERLAGADKSTIS